MCQMYFITVLLFLLSITGSVFSYTREENCVAQLGNTSIIPGLKEEIAGALRTRDWQDCVKFLKENLCERSVVYGQLLNIKQSRILPNEIANLGLIKLLNILVLNGLGINQKFDGHNHLIHRAVRNGRKDFLYYLISHGADIQVKALNLYTPLHVSAEFDCLICVRLLVGYGAEVNSQTNEGNTPLHLAAGKGNVNIVKHLLDIKDCDKTIKNKKEKTAYDIATDKRWGSVAQMLSRN